MLNDYGINIGTSGIYWLEQRGGWGNQTKWVLKRDYKECGCYKKDPCKCVKTKDIKDKRKYLLLL